MSSTPDSSAPWVDDHMLQGPRWWPGPLFCDEVRWAGRRVKGLGLPHKASRGPPGLAPSGRRWMFVEVVREIAVWP